MRVEFLLFGPILTTDLENVDVQQQPAAVERFRFAAKDSCRRHNNFNFYLSQSPPAAILVLLLHNERAHEIYLEELEAASKFFER